MEWRRLLDDLFHITALLFILLVGWQCLYGTESDGVQPLLSYMHENKLDLRWPKLSLSRLHYRDQDESRSCRLSPKPFVEVSSVRVFTPGYSRAFCNTSRVNFVIRMEMAALVEMHGEYEIHAGYYRSPSRSFNLTLVGLQQEISADIYWFVSWRIRKVGVSTKFENIIFQYNELDKFAFKLPHVEDQCWNFHVRDLSRNMTASEWEVVGSNFMGSLNAALPRGAHYLW